jgi:hypothetical protein
MALLSLALHLEGRREELLQEALDAARGTIDPHTADRLRTIAQYLPGQCNDLLEEALHAAEKDVGSIWPPEIPFLSMCKIATLLPEEKKPNAWQRIFQCISTLPDDDRAQVWQKVAPYLPEQHVKDARATTANIRHAGLRARANAALDAERARFGRIDDAWQDMLRIPDQEARAIALRALVPYLPAAQLIAALEHASSFTGNAVRSDVLATLAPRLAAMGLTAKVTEQAGSIGEPTLWAAALRPILAELGKTDRWMEAVRAACALWFDSAREEAFTTLAQVLLPRPRAQLYKAWREILGTVAAEQRTAILQTLAAIAPLLRELGGEDAVLTTAETVVLVGERW